MSVNSPRAYAAYAREVPAQPALLPFGERVRGEDGEADGVVEVAHHRTRQLVGVHLPPADGFGRRGSGQAARVDAGVSHLKVVVMAFLADTQHFLDLRLRLQHEVLGAAAA